MLLNERLPDVYEVKSEIGSGGGGTVFLAWHKNLRKDVVIKKIHDFISDEEIQRVEVDILKNLHHPYLPQVFDYFTINGVGYTVMDFVQGESLKQMTDKGKVFSEKDVLKIGDQLTEALEYLHTRKPSIIHGDIKPENIIYTPEGNICLIDFNISGISKEGKARTFGCTPGYSAPEQVKAVKKMMELMENGSMTAKTEGVPIDKRSDVYSVGATLYRIYTGKKYNAEDNNELKNGTGEGLLYIFNHSLREDPAKRFSDAEEMHRAFHDLHKKDRKYRMMVLYQTLAQLILTGACLAGLWLIINGRIELRKEKQERYDGYIREMAIISETGITDDSEFDGLFEKASAFYPDRLEAYYQKAVYLYQLGRYEKDCIFIESDILQKDIFSQQDDMPGVFTILAEAYFYLKDYEKAAENYKNAINLKVEDPELYVSYAIALARNGETDTAKAVMETAKEKKAGKDRILLIMGEIECRENDYKTAEQHLRECIDNTDDEYTKYRAYLGCALAISGQIPDFAYDDDEKKQKAKELSDKEIVLLRDALVSLPVEYENRILHQLGTVYLYERDQLKDTNALKQAIEVYEQLYENGERDVSVCDTLANLYYEVAEFDKEERMLKKLEETKPDDYSIVIRYAMIECARETDKEESKRDYSLFLDYYNKANLLIDKQVDEAVKNDDMYVKALRSVYEDLKNGGWINE